MATGRASAQRPRVRPCSVSARQAATEEAFVDEHKELEDEDPAAELDVEAAEKLRSKKEDKKKKKKKKDKQATEEPAPASPRACCARAAAAGAWPRRLNRESRWPR